MATTPSAEMSRGTNLFGRMRLHERGPAHINTAKYKLPARSAAGAYSPETFETVLSLDTLRILFESKPGEFAKNKFPRSSTHGQITHARCG